MPTSETRTHASMTMPLSSTRSRTSMRLVPPAARSTVILTAPSAMWAGAEAPATGIHASRARPGLTASRARQGQDAQLQFAQLFTQREIFLYHLFASGRQVPVVLPPVEPDLLRLVDGTDHQPDADGQQFDFRQRHFDVASHHETFVENPIQDVDQPGIPAMLAGSEISRHEMEVCSPMGSNRRSIDRAQMTTQRVPSPVAGKNSWLSLVRCRSHPHLPHAPRTNRTRCQRLRIAARSLHVIDTRMQSSGDVAHA